MGMYQHLTLLLIHQIPLTFHRHRSRPPKALHQPRTCTIESYLWKVLQSGRPNRLFLMMLQKSLRSCSTRILRNAVIIFKEIPVSLIPGTLVPKKSSTLAQRLVFIMILALQTYGGHTRCILVVFIVSSSLKWLTFGH